MRVGEGCVHGRGGAPFWGRTSNLCSGLREEIVGAVALRDSVIAEAVDAQAALDGRAGEEGCSPAGQVLVLGETQKDFGLVSATDAENPGKDGHVGYGVLVAAHVVLVRQMPIQYIQLPFHLHGEPVDSILDLDRGVSVEMTKASAQKWRTADSVRNNQIPQRPQNLGAHACPSARIAS